MSFDKWWDSINASRYSSEYTLSKDAYNAAIDEAVKIVANHDISAGKVNQKSLTEKIKELKK